METLYIDWEIGIARENRVVRHCHNCGEKVEFRDSLLKRRNANGKDIYEYAIYKCPADHTWNRLLEKYPATGLQNRASGEDSAAGPGLGIPEINLHTLVENGVGEVVIRLKRVEGRLRLDKLLGQSLVGISRSQAEQWIASGKILVNDLRAAKDGLVKEGQVIRIRL